METRSQSSEEDSPRMSATLPTPAAQYLRMSTEDQQYSIANQRIRIQEYAQKQGFNVIKTYEDPGRSGVIIKRRKGLKRTAARRC